MTRGARLAVFAVGIAGFGFLLVWGLTGLPDFGHYTGVYGIQLPIQSKSKTFVADWELSATPADLARVTRTADEHGYFYVAVCDHIAIPESLGSTMGTRADFEAVFELVTSGRVKPVIDEVLPLSEARTAHERMERGEQLGKIVLSIP